MGRGGADSITKMKRAMSALHMNRGRTRKAYAKPDGWQELLAVHTERFWPKKSVPIFTCLVSVWYPFRMNDLSIFVGLNTDIQTTRYLKRSCSFTRYQTGTKQVKIGTDFLAKTAPFERPVAPADPAEKDSVITRSHRTRKAVFILEQRIKEI